MADDEGTTFVRPKDTILKSMTSDRTEVEEVEEVRDIVEREAVDRGEGDATDDECFEQDKNEEVDDAELWRQLEAAGHEEEEVREETERGEDGLKPEEATEESEEGREVAMKKSPMIVTKAQRDEHERTHTPFRSWCKWCVWAGSKKMAHARAKKKDEETKETEVPRISMDYFFMSKEDEKASKNPCLVMKNEASGERYARAVGQKGVGTKGELDWLIKDISDELKSWGHAGGTAGEIILKSDGEVSVKALRSAVAKYHGGKVVPEQSAKGESQSNGAAEESGKTVREFVKIFKGQLEEKTQTKLESGGVVMQWLIRWAAMMVSRFLVGHDGRTGHERRRGRRCNMEVYPFGEKVWYRKIRVNENIKLGIDVDMAEGIWLGHARESNEMIIGTPEGCVRAYDVKRMPEGERWDREAIAKMRGTPGRPNPNKAGTHIPIGVNVDEDDDDKAEADEHRANPREGEVRRMPMTTEMFKKYGSAG